MFGQGQRGRRGHWARYQNILCEVETPVAARWNVGSGLLAWCDPQQRELCGITVCATDEIALRAACGWKNIFEDRTNESRKDFFKRKTEKNGVYTSTWVNRLLFGQTDHKFHLFGWEHYVAGGLIFEFRLARPRQSFKIEWQAEGRGVYLKKVISSTKGPPLLLLQFTLTKKRHHPAVGFHSGNCINIYFFYWPFFSDSAFRRGRNMKCLSCKSFQVSRGEH